MQNPNLRAAHSRAARRAIRLGVVLAVFLAAAPCLAQADDEGASTQADSDGFLRPDLWILGGHASRGFATELGNASDVDVTAFWFRASRVYGGDGGFLGAYPALGIEIFPVILFDQEPGAWAPGFNLLYEHHFVTSGKVLPVLRAGAGFLYASEEVPPGETRHNFSLLAGGGVDIVVGRRTALSLEYRLHHVSNANTGDLNPGINAHTFAIGIASYF